MQRGYIFKFTDKHFQKREAVISAENNVEACRIFKEEYPGRSYYSMSSL